VYRIAFTGCLVADPEMSPVAAQFRQPRRPLSTPTEAAQREIEEVFKDLKG
jgi:hypothetical protein